MVLTVYRNTRRNFFFQLPSRVTKVPGQAPMKEELTVALTPEIAIYIAKITSLDTVSLGNLGDRTKTEIETLVAPSPYVLKINNLFGYLLKRGETLIYRFREGGLPMTLSNMKGILPLVKKPDLLLSSPFWSGYI